MIPSLCLLIRFSLIFIVSIALNMNASENFSVKPILNKGKQWKIGYYEGGAYTDYQSSLLSTVEGLMDMGWIEKKNLPEQTGEDTVNLWNFISTEIESSYIIFVKDAHYTANWDKNIRKKMGDAIIDRLNKAKDLDLMMAMGTWSGKDLANNNHSTPTIVMSTSDPVKAGIIWSNKDSGYDHIHARVDPYRYERQVRIFFDMIQFKTLGVAYENTVNGRAYASIDQLEKVAWEKGFKLIRCFTRSDVTDQKIAEESVRKCFRELSEKSDAVYVTLQGGVTKNSLPDIVKVLNEKKIPSFSQSGSEEVKMGLLASLSRKSFLPVGTFYAKTIAMIFNGAKPRQLNQLFEAPPKIAINLKTAKILQYDPPVDVLLGADEIYQEIDVP